MSDERTESRARDRTHGFRGSPRAGALPAPRGPRRAVGGGRAVAARRSWLPAASARRRAPRHRRRHGHPGRHPHADAHPGRRRELGELARSTSTSTHGHRQVPDHREVHAQTGIKVNYTEDDQRQPGVLREDPARSGRRQSDRLYDLIVMTDWMIEKMNRLGYLEQIDQAELPNFTANAESAVSRPLVRQGQQGAASHGSRASPASAITPSSPGARSRASTTSSIRPSRARGDVHGDARHDEPGTAVDWREAAGRDHDRRPEGAGRSCSRGQGRDQFRNYYGNDILRCARQRATSGSPWPGPATSARCSSTTTPT